MKKLLFLLLSIVAIGSYAQKKQPLFSKVTKEHHNVIGFKPVVNSKWIVIEDESQPPATVAITITFTGTPSDLLTELQVYCRARGYTGSQADQTAMLNFYKADLVAFTMDIITKRQDLEQRASFVPTIIQPSIN